MNQLIEIVKISGISNIVLFFSFILAGCSSLFESDNQEAPIELVDYTPRIAIETLWSKSIGSGNAEQIAKLIPVFNRDRIFIADYEGQVYALDAKSGDSIWNVDVGTQLSSGPGLAIDCVLLGTNKAEVIALIEHDGKELWRERVSSEVVAISKSTVDDIAVIHTLDGRLHGLNAVTGERKWIYERTEPALTLRGGSTPLIERGTVIAGLANGMLVNLDLASGEPRWEVAVTQSRGRSELERIVDVDADYVIQDGMVYVATYQGEVAAVDIATGVVMWRRKMSVYTGLSVDDLHLYVTDAKSRVWALDLSDGSALWQQDALLNRKLGAPAILGNYIVIGDLDGFVHLIFSDDGIQHNRLRIDSSPITAPPVVVDDIAYVYSDDGELTAFGLAPITATVTE